MFRNPCSEVLGHILKIPRFYCKNKQVCFERIAVQLHMKSAENDLTRHTSQLLLENCKIQVTQENGHLKKAALLKTLHRH